MKLKFIPLAQLVVAACLMLMIDVLTSEAIMFSALQILVSIVVGLIGGSLVVMGGKEFYKSKTTVNPINPENASKLVTAGIYQISRNPMYLGFFMMLVAWGVLLGSFPALIVLPLFVWYNTKFQIVPEEMALENKFGEDYRVYKSKVRRWI